MPPVGFEPTIPTSARPQTYALDRAATGIGFVGLYISLFNVFLKLNQVDLCEGWGWHSGVAEGASLLGCYGAWSGK
jgi:hypothetical protein